MSPQKTRLCVAALAASALATPAMAAAGDTFIRVRGIVVAPNEKSGGILPALPTETVRVTQMVTDNIGFELIAATSKHSVSGASGTTGSIGKLASTWVLPPTLTAQYHFAPSAKMRPYVGAGLNYTMFYSDKASAGIIAAAGSTNVHLKDSFGWAAQAGVDIDLAPNMFLNIDVKYIDIATTARLSTANLGTQSVKVNLNPLVFGVGLGFRL
jgi:outer membrane protein